MSSFTLLAVTGEREERRGEERRGEERRREGSRGEGRRGERNMEGEGRRGGEEPGRRGERSMEGKERRRIKWNILFFLIYIIPQMIVYPLIASGYDLYLLYLSLL